MQAFPIGTVTIFTNFDTNSSSLNDKLPDIISQRVVQELTFKVNEKFGRETIIITGYETRIGCVITTISIAVVISISSIGIYNFVKDYADLREGLILIFNDFKGAYLKITQKKLNIDKEKAITEADVQIFQEVPDDLKKYYQGKNEAIIISEKEVVTVTRTAIMRNDILEKVEESEIKTRSIKIGKISTPIESPQQDS